jgi:hypothetical protein
VANATAITLNALTANGSIVAPTAQVLDTGTGAVTLESSVTSEFDRIILEVTNTSANNLTVTIETGEDPPAFRKSLGDVISANMAQSARRIFGPFESARFAQADGKLQVTFTPTVSTIGATFVAYVLPKV